MATIFIFDLIITIDKNTYVIYNIFHNQGVNSMACFLCIIEKIKFFVETILRILGNVFNLNVIISSMIALIMLYFAFKNRKIIISYCEKINILIIVKKIFRFIHKYYIMSFIILFILSAISFSLIYFGHSKKIANRFDNALKNYEDTMKNIITNIVIINETNKYISTNSFQQNIDNTINNKIVINNNSQNNTVEYLKMSFEVSFDILKNSITVIMKDSNDILQFWFAFLSLIMIVFTIIGFFLNNNILNQAREQLKMIKREAKEETNKLIEENNKNISITNLFNLSNQAYYSGNYNSSINFLTEIIKIYEDDFKNEKYDEKSDSYDKAIKNCADAYNNRGNAKANLGNYKHSIKDYNKAIELNPNYSKAYYNRGLSKYNLAKENKNNRDEYNKLINEAIKDYDEAIKLDNNNLDAYNNRGLTRYYLAKENKNNRDKYNKLINEAIKDYDKTIEINKNYSNAYCNRGLAKYDLARLNKENEDKLINEAIEDYNKAIELNSQFAEAYYNRGLAKLQLVKIEEAIKDFIKAYESNNNNNNEAKENSKNQLIILAKNGNETAIKFCEKHNINY